MTCEHKWNYAYNERLEKWNAKKKALDKGTFVHKLLEMFYTLRAFDPDTERQKHCALILDLFKQGKLGEAHGLDKDEIAFIFNRFFQYVTFWTAYDFVPSVRNGIPGVEIGFSKILYEDPFKLFVVNGKIDLLSKTNWNGYPCVIDNKTQEKISTYYGYKPQFRTYCWATNFNWAVVNYFKIDKVYKEEETFRRQFIYISDEENKWWGKKLRALFEHLYDIMFRHGITSTKELTVKMLQDNPSACGGMWETNPCYFASICEERNESIKKLIVQQYYYKKAEWIPWETSL